LRISVVVTAVLAFAAPAVAGVGLVADQNRTPHLRTIAIPGRPGLLTSTSTRIDGLISADDLRHPERIGSKRVPDATARVSRLERRFDQLHDARRPALGILAAFTLLGSVLAAFVLRTRFAARAEVALAPGIVSVALLLGLAGASRPAVVLPLLAAGPVGLALAAGLAGRWFRWYGAAVLALFLVVLAAWPESAGFAAIGPRPEEGGRFYGINNVVETTLLAITMWTGAELGAAWLLPLAGLALVTIGWSEAGADGGGLIVFAVAFAVLALRLTGPVTVRRAGLAVAGAVAAVLGLIGIDLAAGGSSHVTRAFEEGPAAWAGDLGHRLHTSADLLAETWYAPVIVGASLVALVVLARRPRFAAGDALLAGIVVSLLVNDAPVDVAAGGALSYGVLWAWERVDSAPDAPIRPPRSAARLRARAGGLRRGGDRVADAEDR
jgi:hypothetical protein